MKRTALLTILCLGAAQAASVKTVGRIFGYFSSITSHPDTAKVGYNEFGISRAYVDLRATFVEIKEGEEPAWQAKGRITYDVEPLNKLVSVKPDPADSTPPSVSISSLYVGFLKYAYADLGDFRGMPGTFWFRFGMLGTPWIGPEEDAWRFRHVQKVMVDEFKVMSSADVGAGIEYIFPSKYGSIYAVYMNGEGYKSLEKNEFKDMAGRITLLPLAGTNNPALLDFGIHAYYQQGKPAEDQVRNRTIIGVSYAMSDKLGLMGSYLMAENGASDEPTKASGYSAWAWFDLGKFATKNQSFGFFGRYDNFDPDTEADEDATTLLIAGAYYNFAKGWQLALDYQTKTPQDPDTDPTSTIYLHLLSQF